MSYCYLTAYSNRSVKVMVSQMETIATSSTTNSLMRLKETMETYHSQPYH
ncbi:14704_t:CDS:1, partial [Entrophospora sp. SA101]